ncbi:YqaE/Pmp3 family membrane protein [Flavobacterium faecale]|uniref:YqaE/Pmp3 family membrane protein n=1 Tax=Flavobacterium faecale TaxID=1355330 RepID=A0A2S1LIG5_9FLAO|nr:YqaE/Pmp3 family membrane protein [Flavobacterium faecale]AWG23508.1 YqaE/Pmp3 family membrane protein [Flavobacterium faecale]
MLLAILIPWLSFFINGKIIRGIVCLILQITIIGWIPAAIWALSSRNSSKMDKKLKQMEKKIIASNISNSKG